MFGIQNYPPKARAMLRWVDNGSKMCAGGSLFPRTVVREDIFTFFPIFLTFFPQYLLGTDLNES